MSYDHSSKAGNLGDVWKHCVLVAADDVAAQYPPAPDAGVPSGVRVDFHFPRLGLPQMSASSVRAPVLSPIRSTGTPILPSRLT